MGTAVSAAHDLCDEAMSLIHGDRQTAYDHPLVNFTRIAKGWEVILGCTVTPEQVALCSAWIKIARQVHDDRHDNLVDAVGYLGTHALIKERRRQMVTSTEEHREAE